jgi:hypothetical protein
VPSFKASTKRANAAASAGRQPALINSAAPKASACRFPAVSLQGQLARLPLEFLGADIARSAKAAPRDGHCGVLICLRSRPTAQAPGRELWSRGHFSSFFRRQSGGDSVSCKSTESGSPPGSLLNRGRGAFDVNPDLLADRRTVRPIAELHLPRFKNRSPAPQSHRHLP